MTHNSHTYVQKEIHNGRNHDALEYGQYGAGSTVAVDCVVILNALLGDRLSIAVLRSIIIEDIMMCNLLDRAGCLGGIASR